MKKHITKAVAILMAVLMLMSLVPAAALPDFTLPELLSVLSGDESAQDSLQNTTGEEDANGDSVVDNEDYDFASDVVLGKDTSTYEGYGAAATEPDPTATTVSKDYSPYEPYENVDEDHPFLAGGAAWVNLDAIYYGAPASQKYALCEWSANTSIVNTTAGADDPTHPLGDKDLINETTWAEYWEEITANQYENGVASSNLSEDNVTVTAKNGTEAFVYNRYDAMQGKWGLTLDRNVKTLTFTPAVTDLYLSNTPYFYFSNEQVDETKMAISLLIGTPVLEEIKVPVIDGITQEEVNQGVTSNRTPDQVRALLAEGAPVYDQNPALHGSTATPIAATYVDDHINDYVAYYLSYVAVYEKDANGDPVYNYKWYTVTDNQPHPGIGTDTLGRTMNPSVTITDVVDATSEFAPKESAYVDGAITGCIDFTTVLDMLYGADWTYIKYDLAKVRVDMKGVASRINYMYFAPALDTIYTPQVNAGVSIGTDDIADGWENGQTVTVTNNAEVGQIIKIDTTGDNVYSDNEAEIKYANHVATDVEGEICVYEQACTASGIDGGCTLENYLLVESYIHHIQLCKDDECVDNHNWYTYQWKMEHAQWSANNTITLFGQEYWESEKLWINGFVYPKNCHASNCPLYTDAYGNNGHSLTHYRNYLYGNDKDTIGTETYEKKNDNIDYVTVTIPVRKWINSLSDDRKLTMSIDVQKYGENEIAPTVSLWGDPVGSVGGTRSYDLAGDSDYFGQALHGGIRTAREGILAILGNGVYLAEPRYWFSSDTVDRTLGNSAAYDGSQSWYDLLRSPYVYDETVTSAAEGTASYNFEGYTFVANIKVCVEKGTVLTISGMETSGNSAGLNMYDAEGHQVEYAYDGGSGVNPVVDTVGSGDHGTQGYSYLSEAAAYGPYLPFSDYTIFDLIDTAQTNDNIYGLAYECNVSALASHPNAGLTQAEALGIYEFPSLTSARIGKIFGNGTQFMVYATATVGDDLWGAVGVMREDGTSDMGWVILQRMYSTNTIAYLTYQYTYDTAYKYVNFGTFTDIDDFKNDYYKQADNDYDAETPDEQHLWKQTILLKMQDQWTFSNFASLGDFFYASTGTSTNQDLGAALYAGDYPYADNLTFFTNIYQDSGFIKWDNSNPALAYGSVLMYANQYRTQAYSNAGKMFNTSTNGSAPRFNIGSPGYMKALQITSDAFAAENMTDTDSNNDIDNLSVSMTRTLSEPVTMYMGGTSGSYPVLYYDVGSNTDTQAYIGFTMAFYNESTKNFDDFKLYYLDTGNGTLVKFDPEKTTEVQFLNSNGVDPRRAISQGNHGFGYISLKEMIDTATPYTDGVRYVKLVSVSVSVLSDSNSTTVPATETMIRRLEIMQEDEAWLDDVNYAPSRDSEGVNTYVASYEKGDESQSVHMYDSANLINDAYFYNHNYDVKTNILEVNQYGKKGWTGTITVAEDSNGDGKIDSNDKPTKDYNGDGTTDSTDKPSYYSNVEEGNSYKDIYGNTIPNLDGFCEGVYQYVTSLGHMRIWAPGQSSGQFVLTADRTYNINEYKYLYYSYSVRDVDTGIAAEDDPYTNDYGSTGIEMVVKTTTQNNAAAYVENASGWNYETAYDSTSYTHSYELTANGAVDLSTIGKTGSNEDGKKSNGEQISQIVFYFNNSYSETAEFYINYVYLSNTPISSQLQPMFEADEYEYYYMMDNTGGRYSARFPTLDNPSGQITGGANQTRVNPIKVNRGDFLYEGTYMNGEPLFQYGDIVSESTDDSYENRYGDFGTEELIKAVGVEDEIEEYAFMRMFFFYAAQDKNDNDRDILDYFEYKTASGESGSVYDMLWSYGRWYTGAGESGLNTMYVSDGEDDPDTTADDNEEKDYIYGNLIRRYATENYVFLRAGIQPIEYLTYYNAMGGQFVYDGSENIYDGDTDTGVIKNENNYYITQSPLYGLYVRPVSGGTELEPVKYGYTFKGWKLANAEDGDSLTNSDDDLLGGTTRKKMPKIDYFEAVWEAKTGEDSNGLDYNTARTATFKHMDGTTDWFTRVTDPASTDAKFEIIIPHQIQIATESGKEALAGWSIDVDNNGILNETEDDVVYTPGTSVTLTKDVTFLPVLGKDATDLTVTITVGGGAKMMLYTGRTDTEGNPIYTDPAIMEIEVENDPHSAGYNAELPVIYNNVPRDVSVVLMPINEGDYTGYGWQIPSENLENVTWLNLSQVNTSAIVGFSSESYRFSVYADLTINFTNLGLENATPAKPVVSTSPYAFVANRQMTFYSQITEADGYEVVAFGTLYTKSGANYESIKDALNEKMCLDTASIKAQTVASGAFTTVTSAVRQVKATAANDAGQYYFMVTENQGNAVTYYARGYVIYTNDGGATYQVAYSDVVSAAKVDAVQTLQE